MAYPKPYAPRSQGPLSGTSLANYLRQELLDLQATLSGVLTMLPQPATAPPTITYDGMVRIARSPWRPISGVTTDAWVYWDAPSNSWLLLKNN